MILILSKAHNEPSTDDVIEWIHALGGNFIRLNGDDLTSADTDISIALNHV